MANVTTAKVSADGNKLIITIDLNKKPAPSASGKTLIAASTGGFVATEAKLNGSIINVSVNATVRP